MSENVTRLPRRLEVLRPSEIKAEQARPYIVKGLIALGDHAIAVGHPGSGKSAFGPMLAYAVARGERVFGRRVKKGTVIYLASEDGDGMKNRVRALLQTRGDAPDFYLIPTPINLLSPGDDSDRRLLENIIRTLKPCLIVIDTLFRSFPGKENDPDHMGAVVQVVRDLSREAGTRNAAILSLHHPAKGEAATTPRGHGSLDGDADVTMLIDGQRSDIRNIRLGKNRNGPSDLSFSFKIETVEMELDEDGDPVTAAIAVECEADPLRLNGRPKLSNLERIGLEALKETIRDIPTVATIGDDGSEGCCAQGGDWRARFYQRMPAGEDVAKETQRKRFYRLVEALIAKGIVGSQDDYYWPRAF